MNPKKMLEEIEVLTEERSKEKTCRKKKDMRTSTVPWQNFGKSLAAVSRTDDFAGSHS